MNEQTEAHTAIIQAKRNRDIAQQNWEKAMYATFPVGKDVMYRPNGKANWKDARVIAHRSKGAIRIELVDTSAELWVQDRDGSEVRLMY